MTTIVLEDYESLIIEMDDVKYRLHKNNIGFTIQNLHDEEIVCKRKSVDTVEIDGAEE